MNQILSFGRDKREANMETKPAIKFFGIVIIIFALILIIEGAYNMAISKGKNGNKTGVPNISTIQEGSSVIITAEYSKGIDKIVYYWNNGEEAIIYANGKSKIEEILPLPIGSNKLYLGVIDVSGNMTRYAPKDFQFDSSIDSNKPQIEIVKGSGTGTIKMIVTDDKGLKSVTYQWSDDDVIIPGMQEGTANFELELAAKEGERTLEIIATDTSDNQQTLKKTIKGSKKPEISVSKNANNLIIKVTDDDIIDKIEYDLNGTTQTIEDITEPEYEFNVELISGENYIIINAYDVDGLMAKYKGKCNL